MTNILASIVDFDAVTPDDASDLPNAGRVRGIYVGVSGDVSVIMTGDASETTKVIPALAAGIWHPMCIKRVRSTDTTATGILVGY